MSKPISLLSLTQAKTSLSETAFENFKNYHHLKFRSGEVDDLADLVSCLIKSGCLISDFENFFVGYQIPQIGKEFDLLRIGSESIINIELKKTGNEKAIEKQLTQNSYYLSFAGLKTYHYTYLSESGVLFKLSRPGEIEKVEIIELSTLLQQHSSLMECNIDELFHPVNYLVSPFNSTKRFLAGEYFLTQQQEEASDVMLGHVLTDARPGFISLTGRAGTGKSLLAYHVAKITLEERKKVLIFHCGILNSGHELLISQGWEIIPIRGYRSCTFSNYDLVIIDEAQRLYPSQFEDILGKISASQALCIFSFDKLQTLAAYEDRLDIELRVSKLNLISSHTLSEKIRSNKEIADFITMLFNKNKNLETTGNRNIYLKYFSTNKDARDYLYSLDKEEWELPRFTPSLFNDEHHKAYFNDDMPTSHSIIGQEFDNVVVVIDELFSYQLNGLLVYKGKSYYEPRKMLFQNITRARKKLLVLIINNEELLERCMAILK